MSKFFSIVLILLWSISPETSTPDPRIAKIDSVLTKAETNGFNGVILIRDRNQILLHKAYGFADREAQKRMSTGTGFDIGSIVKPFTAVAILKLQEEGKLNTSDTLQKFFPSAPPDKKDITVMQILTHTSGMQDIFGDDYDVVTRDWLLDKAMNAPLIGRPGEKESYSNSGYSLLAIILENVSGNTFERHVQRRVLAPAGLTRVGYVLPGWKNHELAVGYRKGGKRWGTPLDHAWAKDGPSWNLRGNGGMLATAEDLCNWYEALFDGKIIGKQALEKFLAFDAGESKAVGGIALGHAGGNNIFNALQVSYIEPDFHMTFFTSNADFSAEELWRTFRDDIVSLAKEAKAAKKPT